MSWLRLQALLHLSVCLPASPTHRSRRANLNVVLRQRDVNPQLAATSLSLFRAGITGAAKKSISSCVSGVLHCTASLLCGQRKRFSGWLGLTARIPTGIAPSCCTSGWIRRSLSGRSDLTRNPSQTHYPSLRNRFLACQRARHGPIRRTLILRPQQNSQRRRTLSRSAQQRHPAQRTRTTLQLLRAPRRSATR